VDGFDEKMIEEEVKSTKSLIQTFLHTVKAYQLYKANHPILLKFLDRLKQEFDRYFDKLDTFSLQVGQFQLSYRGKVVYESQEMKESLAFLFFKDGIREIRFFKGLESREIINFLNVVGKSNIVNRMEDDLVTLLWEKDFFHIEFTIVDEFLEGGGAFIPVTDEDLLRGLEYRGFEEESIEEDTANGDIGGAHGLEAAGLRQVLNLSSDQSLAQVCALNPDELEEIYRRAHREQQPEYLYVLVNNLIEILLHLGESTGAYENMISYFEQLIKSLLEEGEIGKVVAILNNLNDTTVSMALKDKQAFVVHRILEIPSNSSIVELFGKAMKEGEVGSESILQYLRLLTKQAVGPLCYLLRELESERWRNLVCERLSELCREEIEPLGKFLSDSNSFFVSQILHILGRVGHPSTLKYLGGLVNHEDPNVRKETLKLIPKFGEKGKNLIRKFLTDSVPEIRGKASLMFAKMAKDRAVKPLMEIILSEDFYRRDFKEKASFFRALGETGSEEAIPILKKFAKRRRWFKKTKWDEMEVCAANTLRMMGVDKG
jgi:hypothetical protein